MSSSTWSVTIKSGSSVEVEVPPEQTLRISHVALHAHILCTDKGKVVHGADSFAFLDKEPVDGERRRLVTFHIPSVMQQQVDLFMFTDEPNSKFYLTSRDKKASATLYGYLLPATEASFDPDTMETPSAPSIMDQLGDVDDSDDDDDEDFIPAAAEESKDEEEEDEEEEDEEKEDEEEEPAVSKGNSDTNSGVQLAMESSDDDDGGDDSDSSSSEDETETKQKKKQPTKAKKRKAASGSDDDRSSSSSSSDDDRQTKAEPQKKKKQKVAAASSPHTTPAKAGTKGSSTPCKSCSRTFNSEQAFRQHWEAKHKDK